MKTAIQIAIENIEQCLNIKDTRDMLINLLELEKEQIIDAYNQSDLDGLSGRIFPNYAQEYYNQTYKKQKQHIIDIMKADEDDGLYNENK